MLGQLVRRLRAEHRFPISQGTVLGRLDREGPQSVSDLAGQGARSATSRWLRRSATSRPTASSGAAPIPTDGRRALVALTAEGRRALAADRRHREGWLAGALDERLTARERRVVEEAVELLRRLADA